MSESKTPIEPIEDLVKRDLSGWAEFIWNCTDGENYFRFGEYCDLIRTLDSYASDLAATLARAEKAEAWTDEDRPLPEDAAIRAAHPMETNEHARYVEALRLVGAKRSKYALVDLVNWLLSDRDALAARLAEVERERWQPIETAPRNSSRILVAYKNLYGEWKIHEAWWRIPYEAAPAERGYWCHDGNVTMLDSSVHSVGATHWMPLPLPPKDAALAREEKS